jgi:hypothetical protein
VSDAFAGIVRMWAAVYLMSILCVRSREYDRDLRLSEILMPNAE